MPEKSETKLKKRPPIVVVMGHVDHGKTTLLDYIRKTNVATREAGEITQAIGAYEIIHTQTDVEQTQTKPSEGRRITFIDTPGHEAFSKMRSRGAEVADLAILVVAADEGVKPQTKEAVEILKESKTPFVVAINKIDKTGGDMEKAKNELTAAGVLLEGFGGQVSFHGVSAKTGEGINELLDLVLLATDVENLTFNEAAPASGYILEARRDSRRGIEATVIVKNGVLRKGDDIKTKTTSGKVKILENFLGEQADELRPSAPALVIGFEQLPKVGEEFSAGNVAASDKSKEILRYKPLTKKTGETGLNLILKASDTGSLEALSVVIKSLHKDDKPLNVVRESVGDVTDGDIKDAIATQAVIIGFKVRVDKAAKNLAEAHGTKIITSEIVYDLVKAVQEFLENLGKPAGAGELEVLAVFNQKKPEEQLVGGRVLSGIFRSRANLEIVRKVNGADKAIASGKALSLREKKTDITEAQAGNEIGVLVKAPILIKVGDKLTIKGK